MPVAEVPCNADKVSGVSTGDFHQGFGRRLNHYDATVLQHKAVAIAQRCGLRQIEQKRQAVHPGHGEAPTMPVVEIQHDGVGGGAGPGSGDFDVMGAQHCPGA